MFKNHLHRPMFLVFLVLAFSFLLLSNPNSAIDPKVLALENGLARTPPMGWNSWNIFGGSIDETKIKGIADAMVSSGMKDAGYIYLNLDDNWMKNPARDASGNLVCDPTRFPSGLKALGDYIHGKGLKFGIYGDRGTMTCMGIPQSGGHTNEVKDANTYASWTVDYLKYDNCNSDSDIQADYERMRDALAACGRPICFSICSWSYNGDWLINCGNLWRTTGDITDSFSSMIGKYDTNIGLASKAGPGHWNDPDMLEIGNGGMTDTEYRTHMSLWCIMASPLIAGNDIRTMTQATKDILLATEVIAVDQDTLGNQGVKVRDDGNSEVISKVLNDGSRAVALLNRASSAANITVNWSEIGLSAGNGTVRDLWAKVDRGTFANSYTVSVPSHGTVLVKIAGTVGPTSTPTPTPTVGPTATPGGWSNQDIGTCSPAGSYTYSSPTYTVKGAGADIWGTVDAFQYVYKQRTGDYTITARVATLQNTNAWAKAAVMIRETLNNNSKYADMIVTPTSGTSFQWRATAGGSCSSTDNASGGAAPKYLKLTRTGNSFSAYQSNDGTTWTQLGSAQTITMASSVYVGLAVTSHVNGTLCTATFDNVNAP
jgi:alpha-galactosidase